MINSYEDKNVHTYYDVDKHKVLSQARKTVFAQLKELLNTNKINPDIFKGSVIDVGCGTGNALVELSEAFEFKQLYGIEPSAEMLKIAKSKLPHLIDICDSGANIDQHFSQPTADLLNLHFVFAFLDYKDLVQKAAKIIKKDGLLSICTTTSNSFLHSQKLAVNYLNVFFKYLLNLDLRIFQKKYADRMPKDTQAVIDVVEKNNAEVLSCETIRVKVKVSKAQEAWNFLHNAGWFTAEIQSSSVSKFKISCVFYLMQVLNIFDKKSLAIEDEIEIVVLTAKKKE
jgi:ubiquinone/menaquinone biosynthesis C-methylase UbiE